MRRLFLSIENTQVNTQTDINTPLLDSPNAIQKGSDSFVEKFLLLYFQPALKNTPFLLKRILSNERIRVLKPPTSLRAFFEKRGGEWRTPRRRTRQWRSSGGCAAAPHTTFLPPRDNRGKNGEGGRWPMRYYVVEGETRHWKIGLNARIVITAFRKPVPPPLPRHLFLRPLFAIHSTTARNVSSVRPSTRLGGTRLLLLLLLKRELKIAIAFGSSFPRNPSYTRSTIDRGFPSKSIIGRSVWLNTSHYFLRFVLLAPAKMLRWKKAKVKS